MQQLTERTMDIWGRVCGRAVGEAQVALKSWKGNNNNTQNARLTTDVTLTSIAAFATCSTFFYFVVLKVFTLLKHFNLHMGS